MDFLQTLMELWFELLDAWEASEVSRLPETYELWGKPIRFWAILGIKVTAFGFVSLVFEIIGPKRIKSYGDKLINKSAYRKNLKNVNKIFNFPKRFIDWIKSKSVKREEGEGEIEREGEGIINNITLRFYSIILIILPIAAILPDPSDIITYPIVIIILLIILFFWVGSMLLVGLKFSFNIIVLRPIAIVLGYEKLSVTLKVLTAIALLFGFHFALLAA